MSITHGKQSESPRIVWLIIVFIAVTIGTLILLAGTGLRMASLHAPLVYASMEIKYEITQFHLWFEELILIERGLVRIKGVRVIDFIVLLI